MPLWFPRGLRRGVVTTHYPARADASAAALPTSPMFRPAALTRSGDMLIFDVGACTACGRCRQEAPGAVTASGEFELAATERAHLVKRIPLLGDSATVASQGRPE